MFFFEEFEALEAHCLDEMFFYFGVRVTVEEFLLGSVVIGGDGVVISVGPRALIRDTGSIFLRRSATILRIILLKAPLPYIKLLSTLQNTTILLHLILIDNLMYGMYLTILDNLQKWLQFAIDFLMPFERLLYVGG